MKEPTDGQTNEHRNRGGRYFFAPAVEIPWSVPLTLGLFSKPSSSARGGRWNSASLLMNGKGYLFNIKKALRTSKSVVTEMTI